MCTVTYYPLEKDGYILTSSRDEKSFRGIAIPPRKYLLDQQTVFYPKDPDAGGTWFVTTGRDTTLCLLNGAYVKHKHEPPYRKSRGLVVLDYFKFKDADDFRLNNNFHGVEPFTLVIIQPGTLSELKWDGENTHYKKYNPAIPAIWSSVTLYEPEVITARQQWYNEWLQSHHEDSQENLMTFHLFGGNGDVNNNVFMNRENKVRTVSITSIFSNNQETRLQYTDVLQDKNYKIRII
jgi:hypothetical protein